MGQIFDENDLNLHFTDRENGKLLKVREACFVSELCKAGDFKWEENNINGSI